MATSDTLEESLRFADSIQNRPVVLDFRVTKQENVFPMIPSIAAVIVGQSARREIAADPNLGGDGLAQAAVILGWVGIAIGVVIVALFVFVIGSFFAIGSSG